MLPDATSPVELGYAITRYGAQGMSVDRAFVVMTDGLTKEDAYVALTRAREATELHAVAREPIERAEFAPEAEERAVESRRPWRRGRAHRRRGRWRSTSGRAASSSGGPTRELVAELERAARDRDEPPRRWAEHVREDLAKAEARLADLRQELEQMASRDPERQHAAASYRHTADMFERLRAQETGAAGGLARAFGLPPSGPQRSNASSPGDVAQASRLRSPPSRAYLVEALGQQARAGLQPRLEWERAVDRLEGLRQRLGVKDRDGALGVQPRALVEQARWREAMRELERLRARVIARSVGREATRSGRFEIGL